MPRVYTFEQLVEIGNQYFAITPKLKEVVERCDIRRAVLERTANAYRIVVPQDEQERRLKALKGLLNKITPEKYEELTPQMLQHWDSSNNVQLLSTLFDKAFMEQKLNEIYAQLCADVRAAAAQRGQEEEAAFCRALSIQCSQASAKLFAMPSNGEAGSTASQDDADRMKKQVVGCGKFIGELFRFNLVTEAFVLQHLKQLLRCDKSEAPGPSELQGALCLLEACGEILDPNPTSPQTTISGAMDGIIVRITELSKNYPQPRMRFLLMDLLDLRKRNWIPRHPKPRLLKLSEGSNLKQVTVPTTNPELRSSTTIPEVKSLASRFQKPLALGSKQSDDCLRLAGIKRKERDGEPEAPPAKAPTKIMSFAEKCAIWAKIDRRKEADKKRIEEWEKAQKEAYKQSTPHLRDGAVWERGVMAPGAGHCVSMTDHTFGEIHMNQHLEWLHRVPQEDLEQLYDQADDDLDTGAGGMYFGEQHLPSHLRHQPPAPSRWADPEEEGYDDYEAEEKNSFLHPCHYAAPATVDLEYQYQPPAQYDGGVMRYAAQSFPQQPPLFEPFPSQRTSSEYELPPQPHGKGKGYVPPMHSPPHFNVQRTAWGPQRPFGGPHLAMPGYQQPQNPYANRHYTRQQYGTS